jgi:hypothetical protein
MFKENLMEQFQWPQGAEKDLEVYPIDHPQRQPTEEYFANSVRRDNPDVRNGNQVNLWLLIDSLKNLKDPKVEAGFHTWLWAITAVLGADTCREIGKRVCEEEHFTIKEGKRLRGDQSKFTKFVNFLLEAFRHIIRNEKVTK